MKNTKPPIVLLGFSFARRGFFLVPVSLSLSHPSLSLSPSFPPQTTTSPPPNERQNNPKAYFDLQLGRGDSATPLGRVVFELKEDVVPRTATNFAELATRPEGEGFVGSRFHRIIPSFMCQGGDFTRGDGRGGKSIYGSKFADEPFVAKHTGPGLLSSANSGPDSNGCQFFLTCAKSDWLDNKHVVFGRVLGDSLLVVRKVEAVPTSGAGNRPSLPVVITECGEM